MNLRGLRPLTGALSRNAYPVTELLLECGADVNDQEGLASPMCIAAQYGYVSMLEG